MNILRRMGSASSSSSKIATLTEEGNEAISRNSSASSSRARGKAFLVKNHMHDEELTLCQAKLEQSQKALQQSQKELITIHDTVAQLKLKNERIQEELDLAREELDTIRAPAQHCYQLEKDIVSKDRIIKDMEIEIEGLKENLVTLKQKYKARLKSVRENSGKKRQDISLQLFELKDEISRLTAENEELQKQIFSPDPNYGLAKQQSFERGENSKSDIIIELSTQISEQDYRISKLETEVQEKDELIAKLLASNKSSSKSIIEHEADKATEELKQISKELHKIKRSKKKIRAAAIDQKESLDTLDYMREASAISKDSGAVDLRSSHQSSSRADVDLYSIITPELPVNALNDFTLTSS